MKKPSVSHKSTVLSEITIVVHYNGWHLEKDGVIDSPANLIQNDYVRKLVMAEASDLCWPMKDGFKCAKVFYREPSGKTDFYKTDINGTRLSITRYFLGQNLNIGSVDDKIVFCYDVSVEPSQFAK